MDCAHPRISSARAARAGGSRTGGSVRHWRNPAAHHQERVSSPVLPPHPGWDILRRTRGRFGVIASYKRDALLRLKTVRGHVDGVIGMVEDEVYCPDLMNQVPPLQASLEKLNRVLLRNHLWPCVSEAD